MAFTRVDIGCDFFCFLFSEEQRITSSLSISASYRKSMNLMFTLTPFFPLFLFLQDAICAALHHFLTQTFFQSYLVSDSNHHQ